MASRLATLETHEGAVEGVVEVLNRDGMVLGTRVVTNSEAPPNLAELMESGATDAEGYSYTDVSGAQGDGEFQTRYRYVKRLKMEGQTATVPGAPSAVPEVEVEVFGPALRAIMNEQDQTGDVDVLIRLRTRFTTKLKPASGAGLASLYGAEQDYLERHASFDIRKTEAEALQADVKAALAGMGAHNIGGLWLTNGVTARVPKAQLNRIANIPNIERIEHDPEVPVASATQWDGDDIKAANGMNAGIYHDAGYNGQAYYGAGGRHMRLGMIYTDGWYEHPGFDDNVFGDTRTTVYDCTQDPCVANQSKGTGVGAHDLKCAGLAAGSLRQEQISGYTSQQELERSGVAEEPNIYFLEGTSTGSAIRAIGQAVDLGLDVLSGSRGAVLGSGVNCDGQAESGFEEAIMEAQLQNILVVMAGGDEGLTSGCKLRSQVDIPSLFVAGGTGSGSNTCTSSNYSTCGIGSYSSRGGYDATVDGATATAAISGVSVSAPGCPQYYYTEYNASPTSPSENYIYVYPGNTTCGTSYSAPQLAGAAILVKDYFLTNSFTYISNEGRPFVVMLAMGDRQGTSGRLSTGFDPNWGGGRFQMRRFDGADHVGVWGWETYSTVFSSETASNHQLWGSGTESSSLNQFKVYMMFFEQDATDIAKIDMRVRDDNCSATSASLGLDSSDDVKKMVRVGSTAAGKALCARLHAIHMPSGASRRAHVFAYYSGDTVMR